MAAVAPQLLARGVLNPEGHEAATTSLADHDDVPVTVTWSAEHRAFGYFSATAGWVTVPADRLAMYRISLRQTPASAGGGSLRIEAHNADALLPNLLWEVGDVGCPDAANACRYGSAADLLIRKSGAGSPKPFVHARRRGLRIVLSLTPADRLSVESVQGHSIIGLRDIVDHARGLVVDPDLLAARIASGSPSSGALITMAADGAAIAVRGKRYNVFWI